MLGNIPEVECKFAEHLFLCISLFHSAMHIQQVLQIGDILDTGASYDERSVIIFLVFLASQLLHHKKLVRLHAHVILYDLIILCLTITCVGTASSF